jgi:thiosulfate/3-mercaptopyruvate sulfurtransferase
VGEYQAGHIPGAVFWDLDALSDRASSLPHMLPDIESLGRSIGTLGIGNQHAVVVYDGSGHNLSAARVWWTLRVAGHQQVAVLDGGMAAWRAAGLPVQAGWTQWRPCGFRATLHEELVRSRDQVAWVKGKGGAQVLDARSRGRFAGSEPEPRPGLRAGHIPGAKNLPYAELVAPDGLLHSPEALREKFRAAGLDLQKPVITSCGSGVTACALALGLEVAGVTEWSVYDGSWAEWGRPDGPPVEK